MTNIELIKGLIKRLKKFSWLIILIALSVGGFFYYVASRDIPLYTSSATVFPLNSSGTSSSPSSAISSLLGMTDVQQSFSGEASINIVELAGSRRTREAVAMTRVPSMKNKMIAQLLAEENNKHLGFRRNQEVKVPTDSASLINYGSSVLRGGFASKINKNGILELHYTNSDPELVKEISYVYIEKISNFYIELKKKKAQLDFDFAVKKADSLFTVLSALDKKAIRLDESTFFTNQELQRFSIPKINLAQDKASVQSQYYYAVNNRESAAYKLQKETPIIETLDTPELASFDVTKKSTTTFALIGLVLGTLIGIALVSWKLVSKYLGEELNKAIEKASKPKPEAIPQAEPLK